jgi:hypothetical protein
MVQKTSKMLQNGGKNFFNPKKEVLQFTSLYFFLFLQLYATNHEIPKKVSPIFINQKMSNETTNFYD